jgi:hypothetical protein
MDRREPVGDYLATLLPQDNRHGRQYQHGQNEDDERSRFHGPDSTAPVLNER